MPPAPVILLCRCSAADVVPRERTEAVARDLARNETRFEVVDDLCGAAARRDPLLACLASRPGTLRIAACYPRAVKWLFAAAGSSLPSNRTEFLNLRVQEPAEIAERLLQPPAEVQQDVLPPTSETAPQARELASGWRSWFPVIDFDLCTHCMQCLSFCLFGVYGVDRQRGITVTQPENCKTNCPACSRVCPEAAIVFPKFHSGPINGEGVDVAGVERQAMKVDISALLGGDVYAALRNRSGKIQARFSEERDPETALQERRRCLAALAHLGDIPPEVLMSLPSPEEIQRRAEEAKSRAEAALASGK
jgi:Pyruvate/2-oxoacid:ferredoxin oxidoreductase delta subunit